MKLLDELLSLFTFTLNIFLESKGEKKGEKRKGHHPLPGQRKVWSGTSEYLRKKLPLVSWKRGFLAWTYPEVSPPPTIFWKRFQNENFWFIAKGQKRGFFGSQRIFSPTPAISYCQIHHFFIFFLRMGHNIIYFNSNWLQPETRNFSHWMKRGCSGITRDGYLYLSITRENLKTC